MKKIILYILSTILYLTGCQDFTPVSPPPEEFTLKNRYGIFIDTTFTATIDTFNVTDRISTSSSAKLSIGLYEGYEAGFLLKFTKMPEISEELDSVVLELTPRYKFGAENGSLNIDIFDVEDDWDGSANLEDVWHNWTGTNPIMTATFGPDDSSKIRIPLTDTTLIKKWQREGENSKGLYFRLQSGGGDYIREIVSFKGFDTDTWPRLIYKTLKDSSSVADSTNVGQAATIFDYKPAGLNIYDEARIQKHLLITSGISARTFLNFEGVESIPENAIVHSANITIMLKDTSSMDNPLINPNRPSAFYLRLVTEANDDLSNIVVDSAFTTNSKYNLFMEKEGNVVTLSEGQHVYFGGYMIQDIVNKYKTYKWFMLQYNYEYQDISVERLYSRAQFAAVLNVKYYRIDKSGY